MYSTATTISAKAADKPPNYRSTISSRSHQVVATILAIYRLYAARVIVRKNITSISGSIDVLARLISSSDLERSSCDRTQTRSALTLMTILLGIIRSNLAYCGFNFLLQFCVDLRNNLDRAHIFDNLFLRTGSSDDRTHTRIASTPSDRQL
jgi:hypothetical protein